MTDGILALSRKMETSVDEEKEIAVEKVQEKRRKSQNFADYIVTEDGIKEEGTTSMFFVDILAGDKLKHLLTLFLLYLNFSEDKKYDALLRKFQYRKALDNVLSEFYCNKNPEVTVAVFQELIRFK